MSLLFVCLLNLFGLFPANAPSDGMQRSNFINGVGKIL
jgi:hypothetical protein